MRVIAICNQKGDAAMLKRKEDDIEILSGSFADGKGARILVRIGNQTGYRTIREHQGEKYITFGTIEYSESDFIDAAWIVEIDLLQHVRKITE